MDFSRPCHYFSKSGSYLGHKENINIFLMLLFLSQYVPFMLLWCVVYFNDIKHQHKIFFVFLWSRCHATVSQT